MTIEETNELRELWLRFLALDIRTDFTRKVLDKPENIAVKGYLECIAHHCDWIRSEFVGIEHISDIKLN